MAYQSRPTVTRPANTTAYTAGDVVGGAFQFTGFPDPENTGGAPVDVLITSASLRINVAAIPSGMTSFRYRLYDGKPPSNTADNAAFDLASGDRSSSVGYIDVGSPADDGGTLYCQVDGSVNKQIRITKSLWGYMVTNGGFTPAGNSEAYVPELSGIPI